jgi:steroid 5-alpha reductase family enzyme
MGRILPQPRIVTNPDHRPRRIPPTQVESHSGAVAGERLDLVIELLTVAALSLAVAVVAMVITAVVARRVGRVSVVDVTWGLGLTATAVACALLGDGWLPWLVLVLVAVWGCRLSWHIWNRARGHGEDPRYAELLAPHSPDADRSAWFAAAVRKVFVFQGAALWFVGWPLQAAAVGDVEWVALVWVGAAVWVVGFVFEAVGDAQLAAYKRDPDRGPVMDRGLWAWTRHPNYFGDACVWWGIWLAGAASTGWLAALVTVPTPIAMSYFLAYATGARPLERTMMKRPGYPEYAARTSMFFPLPPRR